MGIDLVTLILKTVGTLRPGEEPSDEDATDGLELVNLMLDAWKTEALICYVETRVTHALTANDQTYTIGSGGNINRERPIFINRAGIIPVGTGAREIPIGVLSRQRWAERGQKGSGIITGQTHTSTYPYEMFYDRDWAAGLGQIVVLPMPTTAPTLVLYALTPLSEFADLSTTDYTFPPGYREALHYDGAKRFVASGLGKKWTALLEDLRNEALAKIQRVNAADDIPEREIDPALRLMAGPFNINTGGY